MIRVKYILLSTFIMFFTCAKAQEQLITILDSEEIRTQHHSWTLLSVERRADCTILEKMVVPIEDDKTWISSDKKEFIEDARTGEKFYIISSEIGFGVNEVILEGYDGRTFKEIYPALPGQTQFLNVSSGTKYFVNSLDLSLDISPEKPPVSNIAFWGIRIGTDHKNVLKSLNNLGFEVFYKEEQDGLWGGTELRTYLYKDDKDYPVTVQLTTSVEHGIVTDAEVLYQNHVDIYEVNEHLQELADEVKLSYQNRDFEELTPEYRNSASMLIMKSGRDKVFKNVSIVLFRGYYYIGDSPGNGKDDFLGTISFEVHQDGMHNDYVISVRYSDRKLSRYIRRSFGKYRW